MYKLLEKNQKFEWKDDMDEAFAELKEMLCNAPILAYPNVREPFILDCDASDEGIGAVLSQLGEEGKEGLVAYFAKSMSKAEKKYCVT